MAPTSKLLQVVVWKEDLQDVPRNYRSPYTLDLEKKLTSACIGLLGRRGL